MSEKNPLLQPVLKWVGGKRQLLDYILPLVPNYANYCEPFIGGGAVLFQLQPKKCIINDSNSELINLYKVIAVQSEELINKLQYHKENNCEEYFYQIRSLDRKQDEYKKLTSIERAARIIYLNKTCYNGLFRVNSSGEFNSPWGRYKNPNIVNETVIRAMSKYFSKAKINIQLGDYKEVLKKVRRGTFVYLDPPYMPISSSSSFTGYTIGGFGEKEQIELKKQCDMLSRKNIKFLLSNSSCEFIEELYSDYIVEKVPAKRSINSNADKRGCIDEVLVRNYEFN